MGVRSDGSTDLKMTALQNVSGEKGYASLITGWKEYDGKLTAYVAGPYTPDSAYKNELICAQWANGKYLRLDGTSTITADALYWKGNQTNPYPIFRRMTGYGTSQYGDNFVIHGMNQLTFLCSGESGKVANDDSLVALAEGAEDLVLCSDNNIVFATGANGDDFTKVKKAVLDSQGNLTIPAALNSASVTTSENVIVGGILSLRGDQANWSKSGADGYFAWLRRINCPDSTESVGTTQDHFCLTGFNQGTLIFSGETGGSVEKCQQLIDAMSGSEDIALCADSNLDIFTGCGNNPDPSTFHHHVFRSNGHTEFGGHLTLSSANMSQGLIMQCSSLTKGTPPSANTYFDICFNEAGGTGTANRFGAVSCTVSANGATSTHLFSYANKSGVNEYAHLSIGYDANGNVESYAPTPPMGDRSTQIATTACFDNEGFLGYKALSNINSVKGCFYADSSSGINLESAGLGFVQNADWYLVQFAMKNGNDKSQYVFNSGNVWRRYSDSNLGSESWSDWVQLVDPNGCIAYSAATPASNDNSTKVATTAWANAKFLPLAGGTVTGTIKAKSFQATSDARLKENKTEVYVDLLSIKPMRYTFKDDPTTYHVGLIAQEVEKVLPEAVRNDSDGFKSLDYNAVVAALVGEVNKLKEEVKALKAQLQ